MADYTALINENPDWELVDIYADRGIPRRHLRQLIGLSDRELRRRIQEERLAGIPILSDNASGYFLPSDEKEKQRFIRSMRGRAQEIEAVAAAVESVSDSDTMSAEDVRSFCTAHLILTPSLDFLTGEGDAVTTILKIKVQKPDLNQLMNRLGFDEQARTWAGAMFEVLRDSDALNKYSSYFEDYRPSYEGDTSFEGGPSDIEHGGSYGSGVDTSDFASPGTKNNLDLVAYAIQAWENNWGYVWGTYGNVLTESLFSYKLKQYPDGVGKYKDFIRANWLGRRTADCIGLIKGYGWLNASSGAIRYGINGIKELIFGGVVKTAGGDGAYRDSIPCTSMPRPQPELRGRIKTSERCQYPHHSRQSPHNQCKPH